MAEQYPDLLSAMLEQYGEKPRTMADKPFWGDSQWRGPTGYDYLPFPAKGSQMADFLLTGLTGLAAMRPRGAATTMRDIKMARDLEAALPPKWEGNTYPSGRDGPAVWHREPADPGITGGRLRVRDTWGDDRRLRVRDDRLDNAGFWNSSSGLLTRHPRDIRKAPADADAVPPMMQEMVYGRHPPYPPSLEALLGAERMRYQPRNSNEPPSPSDASPRLPTDADKRAYMDHLFGLLGRPRPGVRPPPNLTIIPGGKTD